MPAHRYFLRLSYHGKNYHGWQAQPNAHTVQAEIDSALLKLTRQQVETVGCGRTDTGVHAKEFFAHFDLDERVENCEAFCHHLNGILPTDIAVQQLIPVKADAHARFDAVSRTYEYRLYRHKNPFLKEVACFYPYDLDVTAMNNLARVIMQYSDFSCFSKSNTQVFTNNCKIMHAEWTSMDHRLVFTISANRFLRNMVRAIVGTLLEGGMHRLDEAELRNILEQKDRKLAGASMPACGLFLTAVAYPEGYFN